VSRGLVAFVVVAAWCACAQAAPGSLASACQLDFQLFCPDLDPESALPEVKACLAKNLDTLTEECRAALDPALAPAPAREVADPVERACRDDFQRLCGGAADRMSFARCVQRHERDLSSACRAALDAAAGVGAGSHGTP